IVSKSIYTGIGLGKLHRNRTSNPLILTDFHWESGVMRGSLQEPVSSQKRHRFEVEPL
ncbi:hypothetical protein JMJ77_0012718, partial [Colletotrichum scovillei]